ncbi:putative bifunctional diguanylate cyclase/phosphodiesterase [Pseudokineococcus lusitanus]|uniref:putative bifunctional diguanylate cyclase/phosphodiesterase n=1 Tax=Pseudokineococcus lusitanus TaxID=763993 RepID=UPI0011CDD9EB|nr:EAL domain-containing protein [Pseudokineococcus lusitanus]
MATAVVATASIADRLDEAEAAGAAADQVRLITVVDDLRRAVDVEALSVVALDLAVDGEATDDAVRRVALHDLAAESSAARRATDRAVDALAATAADLSADGASAPSTSAATVSARLLTARSAADQSTTGTATTAQAYLSLSDTLGVVQQRTAAQVAAGALSARSTQAVQDLERVLQLERLAGQEAVSMLAARTADGAGDPATGAVAPGPDDAQERWLATWGAYTQLAGRSESLSTPQLRVAWRSALTAGPVQRLDADLTLAAGDGRAGPQRAPEADELLDLGRAVRARDGHLAALVEQASSAVGAAVTADAAGATSRAWLTAALGLAALAVGGAGALTQARWLSRAVRRLAEAARRITAGELIAVPVHGPGELRDAARALADAVSGLDHVQAQARAIARGDLETAMAAAPLPGPLGEVVRASLGRITATMHSRDELRSSLAHQAVHDALTGLPNRARAVALVTDALGRSRATGSTTGLLFVDLDGFKKVNDAHGHAAGDHVLRVVAQRLAAAVRPGDVVARLGGDEFVVLVEDVRAPQDLVLLGRRLVGTVSAPVLSWSTTPAAADTPTTATTLRVGASVGVALGRGDGATADASATDALLAEADTAVYRAKAGGRGRVEVFDDALRAEMTWRSTLEAQLRAGLAADELHLVYQPVVDLRTGATVGYEALARWDRPGSGPVPPDVFVPVAEASTLVCELGRWVLRTATTQLAAWRSQGLAPTATVAVNLSGRHVADPGVVDDVRTALERSGLAPGDLVVEVTETVLVDDTAATAHMARLRDLGVTVAIDDFGTGYTAIGQLARTPADVLKVDRGFVASDDPAHHRLVTLITHAAHAFGMSVVVEGVEHPSQLERCRADGADRAQGYLFSRPRTVKELFPSGAPAPRTPRVSTVPRQLPADDGVVHGGR